MKRMLPLALLLASTLLCLDANAATDTEEPSLIINFDHEALTKQVLEKFPDGLPFDRAGAPTDMEQARKFWQLIADRPIAVGGEVTHLRQTLETISDETGLPLLYGKDALARIEAAEQKMRMVTINDSVQKTTTILCRLAGVEKTLVSAQGLVILGPDDPAEPTELHAAPPKNTFRWRETEEAAIRRAFPNGVPDEMTLEDQCNAILGRRCDVVVTDKMECREFLEWLAKAANVNIVIDNVGRFFPIEIYEDEVPFEGEPFPEAANPNESQPADPDQDTDVEEAPETEPSNPKDSCDDEPLPVTTRVKPMVLHFVTLREAINTAIEDFGLVVAEGLPVAVIIPKEWQEKLENLRRQDIESMRRD